VRPPGEGQILSISTRLDWRLTASVGTFLEVGSTKATASALVYISVSLLLSMVTFRCEHTQELVLPDSGVNRGCGGVNPGSSHGSHLVFD
jgi:hypothetical protein